MHLVLAGKYSDTREQNDRMLVAAAVSAVVWNQVW